MTTKREQLYIEEDRLLRLKWKNDYENGNINIGNITPIRSGIQNNNAIKNRKVILNENNDVLVVENCMICKLTKPITPLYFNTEYNNSGVCNLEKQSGKEQICNTPTYGCRECSTNKSRLKSLTKEEFIRQTLKTYPLLSIEWYNSQPKNCCISNIPLIEQINTDWRVSIQNNGLTKEHFPENCCLIAYEFNVQEQDAIPNLLECWKEAFKLILEELKNPSDPTENLNLINKRWNCSVYESGINVPSQININGKLKRNPEYSNLYNTKHLPAILNGLCDRYFKMDKKSKKRNPSNIIRLNKECLFNKLIKQNFKCYYTGIQFSFIRNKWNYFSLERLNNNIHHTDENTVFICRMFNTAGQLNRNKILTALLNQIHIPLTEEDRIIINNQL